MAAKRGSVYTGALAKRSAPPIPRSSILGGEPSQDVVTKATQAGLIHCVKGLPLLYEHYQIPASDDPVPRLVLLVFRLGMDHVPYFQEPGSKPGTTVNRHAYLRIELEVAKERRPEEGSDMPALDRLSARRARRRGSKPAPAIKETLRKQLQRARKDPYVQFLKLVASANLSGIDVGEMARAMGHIR
jgi:hypothetical protein